VRSARFDGPKRGLPNAGGAPRRARRPSHPAIWEAGPRFADRLR